MTELIDRCRRISTPTWSDALDAVGLTGIVVGLTLRSGALPIAGSVVTVKQLVGPLGSAASEDFGIDRMLPAAQPGQILVIQQVGTPPASAFGGLAALAAQRRGIGGVIIDGACRDLGELVERGLPVFSRGVTPASGRRRARITDINIPLRLDGTDVKPGDMVVADETGVAILPFARIDELLVLAEDLQRHDSDRAKALRG